MWLADRYGEDFESGVLLYTGRDRLPLADELILAVPLSELWERQGVSKVVDWEKSLGITKY